MNDIIILFIIFIIIIVLLENKAYNKSNILCSKVKRERRIFVKNIHYLPHSRCGISNHLIDIMQALLLSLVLKRKLNCITLDNLL